MDVASTAIAALSLNFTFIDGNRNPCGYNFFSLKAPWWNNFFSFCLVVKVDWKITSKFRGDFGWIAQVLKPFSTGWVLVVPNTSSNEKEMVSCGKGKYAWKPFKPQHKTSFPWTTRVPDEKDRFGKWKFQHWGEQQWWPQQQGESRGSSNHSGAEGN